MSTAQDETDRLRDAIDAAAAEWTSRLDRGLSAPEQDAFSRWLAADLRHRAALAEHRWGWDELDRLAGFQEGVPAPPDPGLLGPKNDEPKSVRPHWKVAWAACGALAAAAAVWLLQAPRPPLPSPVEEQARVISAALAAPCEKRLLEDGTVVELNRGARLMVEYTPQARRVRLERGEANFIVAKDAARPFAVHAGDVVVRALGTEFNVRVVTSAVEVVVAEGIVQVARGEQAEAVVVPALRAREQIVVSHSARGAEVKRLSEPELQTRLAWQPRLLEFTATPLPEIVAEFNRRNPVRLVIGSDALRTLRLSASIRSDNVEGFVRLMESDFNMRAEWNSETEIVLRQAGPM